MRQSALVTATLVVLAALAPVHANPSVSTAREAPFALSGPAANGQRFDLAQKKGRVVMVFYWSTGCAVCRTKLPELRANLLGWKDKPFDLVTVSVDRSEADWRSYEQLQATTQAAAAQRGIALWSGAPDFRHSLGSAALKLPLTLVIDADGKVKQRVEGRMAPEAWDLVADLLP